MLLLDLEALYKLLAKDNDPIGDLNGFAKHQATSIVFVGDVID